MAAKTRAHLKNAREWISGVGWPDARRRGTGILDVFRGSATPQWVVQRPKGAAGILEMRSGAHLMTRQHGPDTAVRRRGGVSNA